MSLTPIWWLFFHNCNIILMIDQKSVDQKYQINKCKSGKILDVFLLLIGLWTPAIIQEHLDNNSILDNLDQSTKGSPTTVVTRPSPGCKHKPLPSLGRRKQQVLIRDAWSFLPRCFWWLVSHPGMFSVAVRCASDPPVHYPVSGV